MSATYHIGLKLSDSAKRRLASEVQRRGYVIEGSGSSPNESFIILSEPLTALDEDGIKAIMWDLLLWREA